MECKILNKAVEMFLNLGFKSVTMDDISKKLGCSKKTIYTHYKNKKALVKATTAHMFEHIKEGIDVICEKNLNPIDELFEIKEFVIVSLNDEEKSPEYQLQKFFPEIYQDLKQKKLATVNECITQNIINGMSQGFYRENLDTAFICRIYFTGITGIRDDETFPKELFQKRYLMESYLEYHIRAIATEKGLQTLETTINKNKN